MVYRVTHLFKRFFLRYGHIMPKPVVVLIALTMIACGCSGSQGLDQSTVTTLGSAGVPQVDLPSLFGDPVGFSLENYDLQAEDFLSGGGSNQEPTTQQIHNEIQRIIMNGGIVGGPNGQLTPSASIPPQYAPLPTQPGPTQTVNTIPVPPQNIGQQQNSPNTTESTVSRVDCSLETVQGVGVNGIDANSVGYTYILSAIGPPEFTVFIKVKWSNKVEYSTLSFNQDGLAGAVFSTANARPPIIVAYSDPSLNTDSLSCASV
jgi:hypothetical protein